MLFSICLKQISCGGDFYYTYKKFYTLNEYYKDFCYTENNKIGKYAFEECKLTNIDIPSNITAIDSAAFYTCYNLRSINIPSSVTKIGYRAFSYCSSLTSINIPSGVTEIAPRTFYYCRELQNIDIPSSVTKIGYDAFDCCTSLRSINIPENITKIGNSAFDGCSSLTSINIPERVDTIGNIAFYGCSKLQTLSLPSAIKFVGYNTFYNCKNLTSVYANSKTPSEIDEPYLQEDYDRYNLAERCTLYVPKGSVEAYSSSNWHLYFNNIKEFDTETGVQTIVSSPLSTEISRYDINGRKIAKPAKGLNIIKYSDGSIRKEFSK